MTQNEHMKMLDPFLSLVQYAAPDQRVPFIMNSIQELLKEKGYNIARRTVAKYREQLGIPVARLRKEL